MVRRTESDAAGDRASRSNGPRARGSERLRGSARPADVQASEDLYAETNVNGAERALSVLGGGALALYASRRRDWTGILLGIASGALIERGVSGRCPVYGALGVSSAGEGPVRADQPERQRGASATVDAKKARKIERAVTIYGRTPEELYEYWRKLENLPRIFAHLESVTVHDARRSRWVAKAPAGRTVEWEAEIVHEEPGALIGWKSLPGSSVPNAGSVNFREAAGGRGTEVRVTLEYEPPAGKLGVAVARALGGEEPLIQVREDLRRYKALMETGELPVSEVPGQGGRARDTFDARVNAGKTGADIRDAQRRAPDDAHEPRHVPQVADAVRGANTTERADLEVRA